MYIRKKTIRKIVQPKLNKNEAIYAILITCNIFLLLVLDLYFENFRDLFSAKNSIGDHITALIFFCSFFVGIFQLFRLPREQQRIQLIAIPVIGLFGFLEEISYGTIFFPIQHFKILGVTIDSLHDFLSVFYKVLGTYLLIPVIIFVYFIVNKYFDTIKTLISQYPSYQYICIAIIFLLCSAILLDLNIIYYPILEEAYEMNAGFSVLWATLHIRTRRGKL